MYINYYFLVNLIWVLIIFTSLVNATDNLNLPYSDHQHTKSHINHPSKKFFDHQQKVESIKDEKEKIINNRILELKKDMEFFEGKKNMEIYTKPYKDSISDLEKHLEKLIHQTKNKELQSIKIDINIIQEKYFPQDDEF